MSARRRGAVAGVAVVAAIAGCGGSPGPAPGPETGVASTASASSEPATDPTAAADRRFCAPPARVRARLARLERATGARVAVHALVPATGETLGYRADERFAFASTIKALAAAVVLEQTAPADLERRITFTAADLVPYSPVTEQHLADGLTLREVLDAAVVQSDNTAMNLMLDVLGGPAALDARLARAGDEVTEVVRREPALNDWMPGDNRDTTTAAALATTLAAYVVGPRLAPGDRALLDDLLARSVTGAGLVRAAVPDDWGVGDKSGTASWGTRNDVAVLRPPGEAPVVLAVLTSQGAPDAAPDDSLVARAAEVVVAALCP